MSFVGLALVALAIGYAVARILLGYPRPDRRYEILDAREAAFLSTASEAVFPAGGAIPESGLEADLPGYLDRLLVASQRRTRMLMRLLFFLVEHATLFLPAPGRGGRRRFSSLELDQRVAVLDGWGASRLFARRLVFTSLRALLTLGYFAHPGVLRRLRVAPLDIESPVCEADLLFPGIGQSLESIRHTRADLGRSSGIPLDPDGPLHPDYAEPAP